MRQLRAERPPARVPRHPVARSSVSRPRSAGPAAAPRFRGPATREEVLGLQRAAGNQAVVSALAGRSPVAQRAGGWSDADTRGPGWNAGERAVGMGTMRRIPVEGLKGGNQGKWQGGFSATMTTESAAGRAIVLLSEHFNADLPADAMLHLHGYAEKAGRPYAGYRQRASDQKVRDVDLDRVGQQLEVAGQPQLIGILAQGGEKSQFGSMDADSYCREVFERLSQVGAVPTTPKLGRVVLSAHSGGGHTVRRMLAEGKGKPQNLGVLALFEAINGPNERAAVEKWALAELDRHLDVLGDPAKSQKDKEAHLQSATRLQAYYRTASKGYKRQYRLLERAIDKWFESNGAKLGGYAGPVRGLFQIIPVSGVSHEEILRGHKVSDTGAPVAGNVTAAVRALGGGVTGPVPTAPATSTAPASQVPTKTIPPATSVPKATQVPAVPKTGSTPSDPRLLPLHMAARMLMLFGLRDTTDLTDALFAMVHPELGGRRIPAGAKGLQREWLAIRRLVVRPALAAVPKPATGGGGGGGTVTGGKGGGTSTTTTTKPGGTVVRPPETRPTTTKLGVPWDPAKSKPIPSKQADLATKHPAVAQEFLQLKPEVRAAFDSRGGFKHYVGIRDLYAKRLGGGTNPAPRLNQLDFAFSFCGNSLAGLDPRVTGALSVIHDEAAKLAAKIRGAGGLVKFEGAFQPRATTDKEDSLSDHALGLALHLNYESNPYLGRTTKAGNKAAPIIEKIVALAGKKGFWSDLPRKSGKKGGESREEHVERAYKTYAFASDAVARYFQEMDSGKLDAAELAKRKEEYAIVWNAQAGGDWRKRDPKKGFFVHTTHMAGDPMLQLIKLLTISAGLQWGGEYKSRPKDLHHFALKVK